MESQVSLSSKDWGCFKNKQALVLVQNYNIAGLWLDFTRWSSYIFYFKILLKSCKVSYFKTWRWKVIFVQEFWALSQFQCCCRHLCVGVT